MFFQLRPSISEERLRHRWGTGHTSHKNVFRCSYIESKPETGVAKTKDYIEGGDTTQKKYILGGGTPHLLS